MTLYRERLWPAVWLYVAYALVIPASLLVLLPISVAAGVATAVVLYAACIGFLFVQSPKLEVTDRAFTAGKASIPTQFIGETTVHTGADAVAARGVDLDARAWLLLRGWVQPVVQVQIIDPEDPTPYWLVSTRNPNELAAALDKARRPNGDRTQAR